eukprot:TRINITY_DN26890_c0_g1_i1.p1 TRINITY_DN26890_c0_g1~~TRINITY_DN26890_c0_g1_i1.p1  ORF type:complete len:229 (-),score=85.90 TRINITY_DN26890_c0_g1_i1:187-873(-)
MPKCNLWNSTSCNRLVAERIERQKHEQHLRCLERARPQTDHSKPDEVFHLKHKLKTRKLQEDRAAEIQQENKILLQKMLSIDTKPSPVSLEAISTHRVVPRTMHGGSQRTSLSKITNENQKLLGRLQKAKSSFDLQRWNDDEIDRQALMQRIVQNNCSGRKTNLRLPERVPGGKGLPRIQSSGLLANGFGDRGMTEEDWAELSNEELEKHLQELEAMKSQSPSIRLKP